MMQKTPRSERGSGGERRDDRGSALVMAIFVLVLLTTMGSALLFLSQNELQMTQAGVRAKKAFYFAEAGLEEARTELWHTNGNDPFTDDLEIASGGSPGVPDDAVDFDPDTIVATRDGDGNVTGFSGYGDDTPLVDFTSFSGGGYITFLTNDPQEGRTVTTDDNDRVMITSIGAGSDNSLEIIHAIIEHGVLIPGVPPSTITMIGPMASFGGGTSKVKTYNGNDCGGAPPGIPGLNVPIVGAIGSAAITNAELGINTNPTYDSGGLPINDTFSDLTNGGEPAVLDSGYGTIDDSWRDCENWIKVIETLRLMADVICADGTELWDTCVPPANDPQRLIFADGDILVPPGTHEGTLIATGLLTMNGNASWTGLLLAVGEGNYLVNGAGNGVVSGGMLIVDVAGPDNIYGTSDDCTGPGTGDNEGFDTPTFRENGGGNAGTVYCTDDIAAAWPPPPYDIREFLQR